MKRTVAMVEGKASQFMKAMQVTHDTHTHTHTRTHPHTHTDAPDGQSVV